MMIEPDWENLESIFKEHKDEEENENFYDLDDLSDIDISDDDFCRIHNVAYKEGLMDGKELYEPMGVVLDAEVIKAIESLKCLCLALFRETKGAYELKDAIIGGTINLRNTYARSKVNEFLESLERARRTEV